MISNTSWLKGYSCCCQLFQFIVELFCGVGSFGAFDCTHRHASSTRPLWKQGSHLPSLFTATSVIKLEFSIPESMSLLFNLFGELSTRCRCRIGLSPRRTTTDTFPAAFIVKRYVAAKPVFIDFLFDVCEVV